MTARRLADRAAIAADGPATLHDAALCSVQEGRRGSGRLLLGLGVVMLAGALAFAYQLREGIGVTGLNDQVFWGLYTVDLVTFIGFSYGGALVSAVLRLTNARWRGPVVRLAEGTALVTLVVGALFPIIHLGHPERVWRMVTQPQFDSPVLWDMVAILTYLLATVLLFAIPLIPDAAALRDHERLRPRTAALYRRLALGWRGSDAQVRRLERSLSLLAVAIIPIAVMVHTVLSYAFSLTSRPGWHSTIFGPYFVLAAIYSGVAIVIVAAVLYRRTFRLQEWITDTAIRMLGLIMAALGAVYAYFLFTEITTEGYVGDEAAQSLLHGLLIGRYAPLFWLFVATGVVVPLVLVAWTRTRNVTGIAIAAVFVILGMWLKRFIMFVPPLTHPLIAGPDAGYVPSTVEWVVTLGATAAVPFGVIALFRIFPVISVHEMEAVAAARSAEPGPTVALGGLGGDPA